MDPDFTPIVRELVKLKRWLMTGDILLGIIITAVFYWLCGKILGFSTF